MFIFFISYFCKSKSVDNYFHNNRNLFLFWIGNEYKFIKILRNIIYLHSKNGKGYKVHLITHENIENYIDKLPEKFYDLLPAHQADYIRVYVIYKYGGIWLDSDTLIMDSLDSLFDLIDNKDGFFIRQNNNILCNGIFGSKKKTNIMKKLLENINLRLAKNDKLEWTAIGNSMLQKFFNSNPNLFKNYKIFDGLNNLYPINWDNCVTEFLDKPYDNYKKIIRNYQPLIVLVNSVYKNLENKNERDILNGKMPLNYFINKSFENMKHLIDYDFIEIGTSNFDTLIEQANDSTIGLSIDAVKYYIDKLPNKPNVKKINVAISDKEGIIPVYYIPEDIIEKNKLKSWFKGTNKIGDFHPLHEKHNVKHLVKIDNIKVIPISKLFFENKVRNVKYLKIDTEGHDTIILKSLFNYIRFLPSIFFPKKIMFESNEHSNKKEVDYIINSFTSIGYKLKSRGYDTIIEYSNIMIPLHL